MKVLGGYCCCSFFRMYERVGKELIGGRVIVGLEWGLVWCFGYGGSLGSGYLIGRISREKNV